MPRVKGGSFRKADFASIKDILVPYRRVSTREQADSGAGMAAQDTALRQALDYRGATALTWDCFDEGKSGKDMNREGLDQALEHIRAGRAGGIIVSKLDRLSRSILDFAYLMELARKEGWNIVALDLGVDLSTPAGEMLAGVLAVFAQFERRVISQRTADGLAEKRAAGVRLGRPRTLDDDLLETIVGHYLASENFSAVARWLNDNAVETAHGGKMWYPASVQKVVQSQDGRKLLDEWKEVTAA